MRNELDKNNIHSVLKNYFEDRFNNLPPTDFEKVIQVLLNEKFDSASVTKKSGDFGADVIAQDGETKIIIEVKRYQKGNKVSNDKVNNLVAAKNYYNADKCIFITTSDFTNSAQIIAKKSDIELWNWNRLTQEFSNAFWNGSSYYDYYLDKTKDTDPESSDFSDMEEIILSLDKVDYSATDTGIDTNWVYLELKNNTENVIDASVTMPKIVTPDSKQFDADSFQTGYFLNGKIYPEAKVQPSFCIHHHKVGWLKPDTKIYIGVGYKIHDRDEEMKQCSVVVKEHHLPSIQSGTPNKPKRVKTSYDKQDDSTAWLFVIFMIFLILFIAFIAINS